LSGIASGAIGIVAALAVLTLSTIVGVGFVLVTWMRAHDEPELGTGPGVLLFAGAVLFGPVYYPFLVIDLRSTSPENYWLPIPVVGILLLIPSAIVALKSKEGFLLAGCIVMLLIFLFEFSMPFLIPH
jgi:hypothetical protein